IKPQWGTSDRAFEALRREIATEIRGMDTYLGLFPKRGEWPMLGFGAFWKSHSPMTDASKEPW
ncbi:MAG: hypothetical protein VX034_10650, partial [Planctomycetota bacterium]|nr:hypothetical protein [Planctomycetota bacterium]